jgi:ferredoxin-2, mitochondrial
MTEVHFLDQAGGLIVTATAQADDNLLRLAQAHGLPLEGTCEGQMACSTCHLLIAAADFAQLPAASEAEEDMLDLAVGVTRYSRLACQITLNPGLNSLTVHLPSAVRNMQGR